MVRITIGLSLSDSLKEYGKDEFWNETVPQQKWLKLLWYFLDIIREDDHKDKREKKLFYYIIKKSFYKFCITPASKVYILRTQL